MHAIPSAGQVLRDGDLISHRLRRGPRRLARRRGDHRPVGRGRPGAAPDGRRSAEDAMWAGHRRRGAGRAVRARPADRHLARGRDRGPQGRPATASSTATAATASAPRCTRTRTCSTTAGPAAGPRLVPGLALAIEPMITMGSPRTVGARRRLDRGHPGRLGRRPRRAHVALLRRRRLGAHRRRRRPGPPRRPGHRQRPPRHVLISGATRIWMVVESGVACVVRAWTGGQMRAADADRRRVAERCAGARRGPADAARIRRAAAAARTRPRPTAT